ncbi:MAG: hypothetical protein AB1916_01525 [Thermodesulfobacteriota bacterium]
MRIGDSDSDGGSGRSPDRRERSAAFRRRHKTGDRVSGRVLRRERPGLSWVDFAGLTLLADIPSDPAPGELLIFEVEGAEGRIRLRELGPARTPLPAALDLAAFRRTRSAFEALAEPLLEELAAVAPADREAIFARQTAAHPGLAAALDQVRSAAEALAADFSRLGLGRPDYRPWLLPRARESELAELAPAGALLRTDFSFVLPGRGAGEIILLRRRDGDKTGGCGARLYLEDPALAPDAAEAALLLAPAGQRTDILGVHPLPAERRGGVLASLAAGLAGRGGHLSSRV